MATISPIPVTINVGHTDSMSILFFDQNGNPMLTTPIPDMPPVWTNSVSPVGADTLSVPTNGLTAVVTAVAPGTDTVTVTVAVGGKSFSATQPISIQAEPQVLTSIKIANDVT